MLDTSSDSGVNHTALNRVSNVGDRLQRRGALAVDSLESGLDGETTIRSRQRPFRLEKGYSNSSPSVEGSKTSTLGSTELHEDGAGVDVLDSATVHIDSEVLEALLGRAKDVGEELFGVHILETTLELANGGTETGHELQGSPLANAGEHNNHPGGESDLPRHQKDSSGRCWRANGEQK